jgi:Winged helix DNA-binding domain
VAGDVLDARARNRALLARQLLLERAATTALRAVERLVGMQAQTPRSPYTALWSRLRDFDPMTLSRAVADRKAVRIALMRSTIHLVTARDALLLRPLMQPVVMRELDSPVWRNQLDGIDLGRLAITAGQLLEDEPRTPKQLGAALRETFPGAAPRALAHAARSLLPLVQVPPRGQWDRGGPTTLTTAEHWLGRPLADNSTWDDVALRYLGAFGPASAADLVAWCRITGLAAVIDRLRPRLRILHDSDGRTLFDLPRAPRPPASTPAPPRFLPDYDNVLLSHTDRNHVFADAHRSAMQSVNGVLPGSVLVDGFVAATWSLERGRDVTRLHVACLDVAPSAHGAIREEGLALLRFLAPDAARTAVSIR